MWADLRSGKAALVFAHPGELVWLAVAIAVVVVAALLVAIARGRGSFIATVLRLGGVALLALAVGGLSIETREEMQDLCLVVSADASSSVGGAAEKRANEIVAQLVPQLRATDQLGGVVFARRAEVVEWPASPPRAVPLDGGKIDRSATYLASGIETAVPLCPDGSDRKILLVSDGNETLGDARRAAGLAKEIGARVYADLPGAVERVEGVTFEKLSTPPLVRAGSVFAMRTMIRNGGTSPKAGTIDLLVNGDVAAHQAVRLDPGINVFEVPYQLKERGSYQVLATFGAEGSKGGESRQTSLSVAGPIRVLVIGKESSSPIIRALRLREIEVEARDPGSFPKLDDLRAFHAVVFDDVTRKDLPDSALSTLETYVKTNGGGFLMTGGPKAFGDKAFQKTVVERALPVEMVEQEPPPKDKGPPTIGVFLVMDRSNSMNENGRNPEIRDGQKIQYARSAALAVIGRLKPDDRVGVIAFDSDPYVIGPLRPLKEQKEMLEDRISRLAPGGGTDFKAALEIATAQLVQSGVKTKHIILLTDGDSNRGADDHNEILQAMARLGITVTTIRIGSDDVNLEFLQKISRLTGGRFYHVQDVQTLPQLVVNDAKQASGEKDEPAEAQAATQPTPAPQVVPAGPQRPSIGEITEVVRGISERELPMIHEVPKTKLKSNADLVMYLGQGERKLPVLATWQYGLGRTAALPIDPASSDAALWAGWPGYAKLWSQLVRWAIREESEFETRQTVRYRDGVALLEIQTFDDLGKEALEAQLFTRPDHGENLPLTPITPRLYRATLPAVPAGKYDLRLARRGGEQGVVEKHESLIVDPNAERNSSVEAADQPPNLDLLREITTDTGGSLNPTIAELVERHGSSRVHRYGLEWLLVPIALVLLFLDMVLRMRAERT